MSRALAIQAIANQGSLRLKRNGNRDEVIGAWIATPGFLKEETKRVDSEVHALDLELGKTRSSWPKELTSDQGIMDQWWNANWIPFMKAWQSFYDIHAGRGAVGTVISNFWGTTTWDGLNYFKDRLGKLRASATLLGFKIVGPLPSAPKPGWMDDLLGGLGEAVKTLFYVVLAVGAGILLIMAIKR